MPHRVPSDVAHFDETRHFVRANCVDPTKVVPFSFVYATGSYTINKGEFTSNGRPNRPNRYSTTTICGEAARRFICCAWAPAEKGLSFFSPMQRI
jgi:hypothetical protein